MRPLTQEEFAAMAEYKAQHGRGWMQRLTNARLNDWKEQWGILREVRNNCGISEAFKCFGRMEKALRRTAA